MNVMIYNKYKDLLKGLNIEVMKTLEGVYNVDEIIDTFTNFYFDKMILDITAIRDYENIENLQKLSMNLNMENVILLLDNNPVTDTKDYISKLISLGIYNFTKNTSGINYLLVHPHQYKDVVNMHNLQEIDTQMAIADNDKTSDSVIVEKVINNSTNNQGSGKLRIIGFKNVTNHAGATSLIYMLKKTLQNNRLVGALEVNKVDFLYFKDPEMISTTTPDLLKEIMKKQSYDILFIDLNDYEDTEICEEVYYLIEPSTLMINKMLKRDAGILEKLKDKKIILNKCMLNNEDIATFGYETKLKVLYSIPALNDRDGKIDPIINFIKKVNL